MNDVVGVHALACRAQRDQPLVAADVRRLKLLPPSPCLPLILSLLFLLSALSTEAITLSKRWLYLPTNLQIDQNLARAEALVDRAQAAGYNGILYHDSKLGFFWKLESPQRWKRNAAKLRQLTRERDLTLAIGVFPFGYSNPILWHNPNLAAGMPVRNTPLIANKGRLIPVDSSSIPNGQLEQWRGNKAIRSLFQDGEGTSSFADYNTKREGKSSLRFDCDKSESQHRNQRIAFRVPVQAWQQYRLRAWMKTENLTAGQIQLAVRADGKWLQHQHLKATVPGSGREIYVGSANKLTTEWTRQSVTFNSQNHTEVIVYAGAWGAKSGHIWWDDISIDNTPTLNLLRREQLPLAIVGPDGFLHDEGRDYQRIVDPKTGRTRPYPGTYDTHHEPPVVRLTKNSRIKEGQTVHLSCYHATLVHSGQIAATLNDPELWQVCDRQIQQALEVLDPDILFMNHDEIRVGGWEPQRQKFETTGNLLAHNVHRCTEIIRRHSDKPIYVWSDMFDPHHNAGKDYYLVKGDLAGSWKGLDPGVNIMKWGGGPRGAKGLKHFADRGHQQMIAAYYDRDPKRDHTNWTTAAQGVPNIHGVMYTTWQNDYSDLEAFAKVWWGEKE